MSEAKQETVVKKTIIETKQEIDIQQKTVFFTGFTFFAGGTFGVVLSLCVISLFAKLLDYVGGLI